MPAHVALVLLGAAVSTVAFQGGSPVGISFNESLVGFGEDCATVKGGCRTTDSISDFESSFAKGKLLNNSLGFSLFVAVPDIKAFRKDPTKTGKCVGNTTADNITDPTGQGGHVPTGDTTSHAATIRIFDGGVLPTHELRMEYTLPFTGADGVEYVMVGTKHMPGNDCKDILLQITTLYTQVFKSNTTTGEPDPTQIVRRGIVKIDFAASLKLIASLRLTGGPAILPQLPRLEGLASFGLFLAHDLLDNCANVSATSSTFHYVWASDGKSGMLLDIIKRPIASELRIAVFNKTDQTPPAVYRQILTLADYHTDPSDPTNVTLGPLQMTNHGVVGTVHGFHVNVTFRGLAPGGGSRTNTFLPKTMLPGGLEGWVSKYAPTVISTYGGSTGSAMIGGARLAAGTPLVRTRYTVPVGLSILCWGIVSASQFVGADGIGIDLQAEVVTAPLEVIKTIGHITPVYVRLDGKEYKMNSELDLLTSLQTVTADGHLTTNNTHRSFHASISVKPTLVTTVKINITCIAPVGAFAFLEKEGKTYIHSTVMGDCTAVIKRPLELKPRTYTSTGVNLIESKE